MTVLNVIKNTLQARQLNEKRINDRIELDICPVLFVPKDGMARERYILKPDEKVIGITGWIFSSNDSQMIQLVSMNKKIIILDDIIYPIYKKDIEISIINKTKKDFELSSGHCLAKAILQPEVTRINILK